MPPVSGGKLQPIIVKRVRRTAAAGHHGGNWKVAYADFVTAMMAFFLLMWLLGSTAQGDLQGIAAYFQSPLKVALSGGSGSGDSSSIIKGGGSILTRTNGSIKRGEVEAPTRTFNLQALRAEVEAADAARMRQVQLRLDRAMQDNPTLAGLKQQLRMDVTADGLRIQIVDDQGRPMFDAGSARVKDYMRELLRNIGKLVDEADARVVLSGHTDAAPYSGGERGYSNWELSADRANASRRELLAGGLREDRVVRVLGLGSSVPFDAADPLSPLNRRISVLVLGQLGRERWQAGAEVPISETQAMERLLERREAEAGRGAAAVPPAATDHPPAKAGPTP
ncbi:flagellar motor protein MotB [Ramlibacter alkalitolerans]|uniref:Flagellar motor protein MotB n=1 Tax=Ramlibacter alkalitolerans TaxID=2039631 RepID=A0ABS1JKX7_9BURK|nr:flagellar motor protein MotB [Ramlibacter alkalitolerans]MBL0424873.1 flagellar motor protein MotB [Ramlibacter alkalitolerans]